MSGQISIGGMNYSVPASLIYFASERQGSRIENRRCRANLELEFIFGFHRDDPLKLQAKTP